MMTTLELELQALKARVGRLEEQVQQLAGEAPTVAPPVPGEPMADEQLLAWLKAEGLVREPTREERRLGAEWNALPEEEKQAVLWELDHLPPGPMASDIIIENRR